jgi:hypothetical protein
MAMLMPTTAIQMTMIGQVPFPLALSILTDVLLSYPVEPPAGDRGPESHGPSPNRAN